MAISISFSVSILPAVDDSMKPTGSICSNNGISSIRKSSNLVLYSVLKFSIISVTCSKVGFAGIETNTPVASAAMFISYVDLSWPSCLSNLAAKSIASAPFPILPLSSASISLISISSVAITVKDTSSCAPYTIVSTKSVPRLSASSWGWEIIFVVSWVGVRVPGWRRLKKAVCLERYTTVTCLVEETDLSR